MAGVAQFKDWILFVAKISNGLAKGMEDGKIGVGDALALLPALSAAFPALAGSQEIPAELADLDEAEQAELVELFKAELDLPNDQVEAYAEMGFEVAMKLAKFVVGLKK